MREYKIGISDRLISVISYITAGWGGMLWAVILYFLKRQMSRYLQFNIFQSIFISLLLFVLVTCLDFIFKVLAFIPFINYLAAQISFIFNMRIFFDYSVIQLVLALLMIYLVLMSLLGKYPRIYKISKIIDYSIRG